VECGQARSGGDAKGDHQLTSPTTLDEIGQMLVRESKNVPEKKRASFEEIMRLLRTPVGGLKTRREE